ncbi:MAG TPA: hypothetical protein VIU40_12010 [Geobacteraceae bacterium]
MKVHSFELRIVETQQDSSEPYDEHRTKKVLGVLAVSVTTDGNESPPSRLAVASAFRSLEHAAAKRIGAKL